MDNVCLSACRNFTTFISALPNCVLVGHNQSIKSAVGYFHKIYKTKTELVTFALPHIITKDTKDRYKELRVDY